VLAGASETRLITIGHKYAFVGTQTLDQAAQEGTATDAAWPPDRGKTQVEQCRSIGWPFADEQPRGWRQLKRDEQALVASLFGELAAIHPSQPNSHDPTSMIDHRESPGSMMVRPADT
jgi:hypothetical protein